MTDPATIRRRPRRGASGLASVQGLVGLTVVPVLLVLLWQWVSARGLINATFFPPPTRVWAAGVRLTQEGTLVDETVTTIVRAVVGWLAGGALGVTAGVLLGRSWRARTAFQPTYDFLRSVPAAAVVPVAVLLLGPVPSTEIAVVAYAGLWSVMLNTIAGVVAVDPVLLDAARIAGLRGGRQVISIQLPSALPSIVAGLRISLSICLIVAVLAEMIASIDGLGMLLIESRSRYRNADVYAVVVLLGWIGLLANGLVVAAERRLLHWQQAPADRE